MRMERSRQSETQFYSWDSDGFSENRISVTVKVIEM